MPHPRLAISALLNPTNSEFAQSVSTAAVDVAAPLASLASWAGNGPVHAPAHIASWLADAALSLPLSAASTPTPLLWGPSSRGSTSSPSVTRFPTPIRLSPAIPYVLRSEPIEVQKDVRITRKTKLSTLYIVRQLGAFIEYPTTSENEPIGYLFHQDPGAWQNPARSFAYSQGQPSGYTKPGSEVFCDVLLDERDSFSKVPCIRRHSTCQGSKICPAADVEEYSKPHTSVQADDLKNRLRQERVSRLEVLDPKHDIFQKTSAFITAIRKIGCRAPKIEHTQMNQREQEVYDAARTYQSDLSRGYIPIQEYCEGRMVLDYSHLDIPYIRCEHYNIKQNRDHLIQYLDGEYDEDYLEAYFNEDSEEVDRIEGEAVNRGYGPLASCTTVTNVSSQRAYCPKDHRQTDKDLGQLKMQQLSCRARYHIYDPLPDYREVCPWTLVICLGAHTHPIPLPEKTPLSLRVELEQLLKGLDDDLPDLTTRRFLRHPTLKSYLRTRLPAISHPSLCDLHPSFANRAHVMYFIETIKKQSFPRGTGWDGLLHLKRLQDQDMDIEDHYVRSIIEVPDGQCDVHDDDEPTDFNSVSDCLRIVVCMTREGSRRMLKGQYMQSDVGFKRVVGFEEFEIACMDRRANTSVIFCRVFVNRQTAAAHQKIFGAIEQIVKQDTGRSLGWRHIHAADPDETDGMILHWALDQHRGQAKGLGLHLQALATQYPQKLDLHEPHRLLSSLSPYEHLHRLVRLCNVHGKRNIRKLAIPEGIRHQMRSLMCMRHPSWDETINDILECGYKPAVDWVNDKLRSKFAFQAMCWEKSFIPESIWKAGESNSNLIEAVHSDVNREGIHCTLVGGLKKGMAFDLMKMKTLKASEDAGMRPSYLSGHMSENAVKNLKRKLNSHHNMLEAQDKQIEHHNKKMRAAHDKFSETRMNADNAEKHYQSFRNRAGPSSQSHQDKARANLVKATSKLSKAKGVYDRQVAAGESLIHTGSGKVALSLPSTRTAP